MSTAVSQSGFAADARQLNPSIDGTLAFGLQEVKDSISFGENMYKRIEHFDSETNYYVFDEGFVSKKNGTATIHFNYIMVKEVSTDSVEVLSGLPSPDWYGGRWFSSVSNDLGACPLNMLVLQSGHLLMSTGTAGKGYRENFSYPCK